MQGPVVEGLIFFCLLLPARGMKWWFHQVRVDFGSNLGADSLAVDLELAGRVAALESLISKHFRYL